MWTQTSTISGREFRIVTHESFQLIYAFENWFRLSLTCIFLYAAGR